MKDPWKLAIKSFPKHGAELIHRTPHELIWRMPHGSRFIMTHNTTLKRVREVVAGLIASTDPLSSWPIPSTKPDFDKLAGTKHFTERFTLMSAQAGLSIDEIRAAVDTPDTVRAQPNSRCRVLIAGRVGVVIGPTTAGWALVTALWTRRDLYLKYPRPEETDHA